MKTIYLIIQPNLDGDWETEHMFKNEEIAENYFYEHYDGANLSQLITTPAHSLL